MRTSIRWTVIFVWLLTTVAVITMAKVRRRTPVKLVVQTQDVLLTTSSVHLFDALNVDDLSVANLDDLQILGSDNRSIELYGDELASCTFSNVRLQPLDVVQPSTIRLRATEGAMSLSAGARVQGHLTSQNAPARSDVTCTRVRTTRDGAFGVYSNALSQEGGDAVSFTTRAGTTINLRPKDQALGEHQIPVSGTIRFTAIDSQTGEEKSTLISSTDSAVNRIDFERTSKGIAVDPNSILVVVTSNPFWLESVRFAGSFNMVFHGTASDVLTGGGQNDLKSVTPTLLDEWLDLKGLLGLIPAAAAAILAFLEKAGFLGTKDQ